MSTISKDPLFSIVDLLFINNNLETQDYYLEEFYQKALIELNGVILPLSIKDSGEGIFIIKNLNRLTRTICRSMFFDLNLTRFNDFEERRVSKSFFQKRIIKIYYDPFTRVFRGKE